MKNKAKIYVHPHKPYVTIDYGGMNGKIKYNLSFDRVKRTAFMHKCCLNAINDMRYKLRDSKYPSQHEIELLQDTLEMLNDPCYKRIFSYGFDCLPEEYMLEGLVPEQAHEQEEDIDAPPPLLPTSRLPDVFPVTTGPASLSLRRGTGGKRFWGKHHNSVALRTTPPQGQTEEVYSVCYPSGDSPTDNYSIREGEADINENLRNAWGIVEKLGADEADWFDLIIATHLDGWKLRNRDNPGTWVLAQVEDLKRARTKGKSNGYRDEYEREAHSAALRRLLSMKLVWQAASAKQGKPNTEVEFDYFHFTEIRQQTPEGSGNVTAFQIYPTWWFDAEMLSDDEHTPMYFQAGLKMVIQIPTNKAIAKAVARYLVGGFWRQRACDPKRLDHRRYKISLAHLFDRAGVAVPEWAEKRPSQFAKQVQNQLKHLSYAAECSGLISGEGALISMPTLKAPDRKAGAFAHYMNQEVELRVHPDAPLHLRETILRLESRGKIQAEISRKTQIQANIQKETARKRTAKIQENIE